MVSFFAPFFTLLASHRITLVQILTLIFLKRDLLHGAGASPFLVYTRH